MTAGLGIPWQLETGPWEVLEFNIVHTLLPCLAGMIPGELLPSLPSPLPLGHALSPRIIRDYDGGPCEIVYSLEC